MSLYDLPDEEDPGDLYDLEHLEDLERFAGVVQSALERGDIPAGVDTSTLTARELDEFEARVIELARIDPSTFIQYAFQWPMQTCHCEWQDLISQHPRLVLWAPVEHGKSSGIVIARPIWELGVNPKLRIAIISNTADQAIKCLSVIKSQIELNPRIAAVFPMLGRERRQGRMGVWHDDKITVQRDDLDNKDPSIQALGVLGAVMGSRIDLALLDDVLDFENTLHPTARDRMLGWHDSSVESRLTANGREALVGTAWHREDLMHTIAQRPAWKAVRYDATTRELWPELSSIGGKLCGWPKWRLDKKRKEIPALEFNRQFRNLPMSEESEIFNARSIEQCFTHDPWDPTADPSWQFYVGVDLNVKKGETRHKTSFFIGRLDGGVKTVQRIIAKTMNLDDILYHFMFIEARYKPVLFLVENNAAQDYIVQWFKPDTITRTFEARGEDPSRYLEKLPRVKGFTTGANKMDPKLGIWGMTIEFEQRRWRIPDHELTRAWKSEMLAFDPHAHTGDILMSSWLFHSAASKFRPARVRSRSISSAN